MAAVTGGAASAISSDADSHLSFILGVLRPCFILPYVDLMLTATLSVIAGIVLASTFLPSW